MKKPTRKKTTKEKKTSPAQKSMKPEVAFLKAFLTLQGEMPELKRTERVNGGGNGHPYSYTTLPIMRKVLQPLLTKHGFMYSWDSRELSNNRMEYMCILTHIGGYSKTSSITAERDGTVDMNNLQAIGSATTYLQRYTLKAVLGLTSADDDDDGRSAGKKKRETIPPPKPKPDGEHNKVVQEILTFKEGENNDIPKT